MRLHQPEEINAFPSERFTPEPESTAAKESSPASSYSRCPSDRWRSISSLPTAACHCEWQPCNHIFSTLGLFQEGPLFSWNIWSKFADVKMHVAVRHLRVQEDKWIKEHEIISCLWSKQRWWCWWWPQWGRLNLSLRLLEHILTQYRDCSSSQLRLFFNPFLQIKTLLRRINTIIYLLLCWWN